MTTTANASVEPIPAPAQPPKPTTRHAFQAEVSEVLRLVIHSLYSHREIFLRELISNASDALDKLRFRSLTEPALLQDQPDLEIRIRVDKDRKTLSIEDTGIGMSEAELVTNLGTIAHSGSRAFLELATSNPAGKKDLNLIGQFGVGFYSAYLVADRVEVISRAAGESTSFVWSSDGTDSFTVEPGARTARGTEVVLHFRDEHKELLETWQLRELVQRYSDFVPWPIKLEMVPAKKEGETEAPPRWEQINRASALWQNPKAEITDAQYDDFYRHLARDSRPPLARTHFRVEGTNEFVGLLYLPEHAPYDLHDPKRRRGVRLFVRRVLIMEECEELVPTWLRFVRGVIDSNDLPLNVSRELLQDSMVLAAIKKQITKKSLDMLEELAKDKPDAYEPFWKSLGVVIKEGLALDSSEYRERIGGLLRYQSSHDPNGKLTSLADYVARMKPKGDDDKGQEEIYYLVGESRQALEGSPHIEGLRSRGLEVLYMTDPVDEWAVQGLREFDGKRLVNAMHADLKLAATEQEKQKSEETSSSTGPLVERIQKVLEDKVREVKLSTRLTDSPSCLVLASGANSPFLERLLKERKMGMPHPKRVFEINPTHPVVVSLGTLLGRDASAPQIDEWIRLLYDQALLAEGSVIEDSSAFARRVAALLTQVTTEAVR